MILLTVATSNGAKRMSTSPIGHWQTDNNGLPAFSYTGALPFHVSLTDGSEAKIDQDPWFLLGNYQLTLFTHVSGEYEIMTGQRSWGRMNQGSTPNSGVNHSVVTINGRTISLAGKGSVGEDPTLCERTFGCGWAKYKYNVEGLQIERTLTVLPSLKTDGGESAFRLHVSITNRNRKPVSFEYAEDVLANYINTQYQRSNPAPIRFIRTMRQNYNTLIADFRGESNDPQLIVDENEMSPYDAYPPSLYLKLLSDGNVSEENGLLKASQHYTLVKGKRCEMDMVIGFGFHTDFTQIDQAAKALTNGTTADWLKVLPALKEEQDATLRSELIWHAYNLEAMATYSTFYRETKIPQGTIYDYYWGQHASARDNFQHAMPLVYYNPELCRSCMRYMAKRTTSWGEVRLVEYGNGYAEPMYYCTSDQQLFFFQLLAEYLRVTKDYAFLDEQVEYFPCGSGQTCTMLDIAKSCFDFLHDNVGRGPHGLVRLLNSDWNDNVFVLTKTSYNTVIGSGESLMNTTMALSILPNFMQSLTAYKQSTKSATAEKLLKGMQVYTNQLNAAFMADLGERTFPRRMYFDGKSIGDDNMYLEPMGYMLQMPDLTLERKQRLYVEMQKRLYVGEKIGARQQQAPDMEGYGLEKGSRENGGVWYSLNGPVISAMADIDRAEGLRLLKMMSMDNYSRQFPQYWTSYWSASDNIESSLMTLTEGLPDQSLDYYAIPVYCAHPHAWMLYCYYRLNE